MAFREIIEAVLKVKDASRFKASMEGAAKSVRKFGRDEEQAAAQTELLKKIETKLEHQTVELAAAIELLAHSVDDLGDEMLETAGAAVVLNKATKKSGSNAIFLGKSWAFWKDRLSLTRSEMITTALTMGVYFSPALIALGSSFAYAAIGGGGVAAAGMSSFVFGLVSLMTVVKPAIDDIKKIRKAQDMYNLAVDQYGARSMQASRASAHLYAVIRQNGGKPAADAATNLLKFSDAWKKATRPGRTSFFNLINQGLKTFHKLTPQLAGGTNAMAAATQRAGGGFLNSLLGPDMRQTFRTLSETFTKSIGPGVRGATNLMIVFGRIIRAAAPWAVKWAQAWERTTASWRDGTRDQSKVEDFINGAVVHFKAWWALAKQLGRTLKIIWGDSKDEGLKIVYILTNLVTKFNDWLDAASENGKLEEFWRRYNKSVSDAVWALQNPIQAINRWLPRVMDAIATGLATHAPRAASIFIQAFLNSGSWAQFLTIAFFLKKFGFFKLLGGRVGAIFVGPFIQAFMAAFIPSMVGATAAEGAIGRAMTRAGTASGKIFGRAFVAGALLATAGLAYELAKQYNKTHKAAQGGRNPYAPQTGGPTANIPFAARLGSKAAEGVKDVISSLPGLLPHFPTPRIKQYGGLIAPGSWSIVGEHGPELASQSPGGGTQITPIGSAGAPMDIPNLSGSFHISVFSSVQVDKREIARAYTESKAYDQARRGGTP